ncbi:MAG: hypothetical protein AMS22_09555 [Thiotrichales bacterium SG8_50]|nr:MAG: hypothetical protein AMS22_09555 [Thiotrichales bacterium SG8_50]
MLRRFLLAGTTLAAMTLAHAAKQAPGGAEYLHRFFTTVNSVQAQFSQVVLDEALNTIQESAGTLYIERPNKFRWDYDAPFKQEIVADGKQIWVYDSPWVSRAISRGHS